MTDTLNFVNTTYNDTNTITNSVIVDTIGTTYFKVTVAEPNYPFVNFSDPTGEYLGWSLDTVNSISLNTPYTAKFVSMLDPNFWTVYVAYTALPPNIGYLQGILYIQNNAQRYLSLGYTKSDIQVAIWTLLFNPTPMSGTVIDTSPLGTLTYTLNAVLGIINEGISVQSMYNSSGDASVLLLNNLIGIGVFLPGQILSIVCDLSELLNDSEALSADRTELTTGTSLLVRTSPGDPQSTANIIEFNHNIGWGTRGIPTTYFTVPKTGVYLINIQSYLLVDQPVTISAEMFMAYGNSFAGDEVSKIVPNSISMISFTQGEPAKLTAMFTKPLVKDRVICFVVLLDNSSGTPATVSLQGPVSAVRSYLPHDNGAATILPSVRVAITLVN